MTRAEIQRGGLLHARNLRTGGPFYTLACTTCGVKVVAEIDSAGRIRLSGAKELQSRPRMRAILDFFLGPPSEPKARPKERAKPKPASSTRSGRERLPPRRPGFESRSRTQSLTPFVRDMLVTLGIANCATPEEIRREYRRFVREHHPDRFAQRPASEREVAERTFREKHQQFQKLMKHLASSERKS